MPIAEQCCGRKDFLLSYSEKSVFDIPTPIAIKKKEIEAENNVLYMFSTFASALQADPDRLQAH